MKQCIVVSQLFKLVREHSRSLTLICFPSSGVIIGREDQLASFESRSVNSVAVSSDKQAIKAAREQCSKHFLTVVHINKFSQQFMELMPPQETQVGKGEILKVFGKILNSILLL